MIALLLALEILARVIQGEVGPLGPDAMILVASTMQTRIEAGTYGGTLAEVIQTGYYADAPATSDSMAAAWALVTGRIPAVGLVYAYSASDRERMSWPVGDLVIRGGGLELHLARREPWH